MMEAATILPREALDRLLQGNQRFVDHKMIHYTQLSQEFREKLLLRQRPFATLLCCADSRATPGHIFDASLGELFVCRNAGNLAESGVMGSIEYSVLHLGSPLVMVLGHTRCGAVTETVSIAKNPAAFGSGHIDTVIRWLLPPVLASRMDSQEDDAWVNAAVIRNVESTCDAILRQSSLLEKRVLEGTFAVVGALYDLASGQVRILCGQPR